MSKKTNSIISANPDVLKSLEMLGLRLRANRVAAGWTVKDMAGRLLCSQNTYRAIEAGKPTASIGIIAIALWLLGQLDTIDALAPAPSTTHPNIRARRKSGTTDASLITEDERDF
jgi:transcriptional regulator with XRE-family HTH domain